MQIRPAAEADIRVKPPNSPRHPPRHRPRRPKASVAFRTSATATVVAVAVGTIEPMVLEVACRAGIRL